MSNEPKAGDRVRLTFEAEYQWGLSNHDQTDHRVMTPWGVYTAPYTSDIEILERADDPANDPVGTVRSMHGRIFVKTDTPLYPWKSLSSEWKFSDPETLSGNMNTTMAGHSVIGVVPGSPADRD